MTITDTRYARATEPEAAALVAALIALTKPARVAECGAWPGRATKALGHACLDIGSRVDTWESVDEFHTQMLNGFALGPVVLHKGHVPDYAPYSLAFIDCGPEWENRDVCLQTWCRTAKPGALAVVDDYLLWEGWRDMYDCSFVRLPSVHGVLVAEHE